MEETPETLSERFDNFTIAGLCAVGLLSSVNVSLGLVVSRSFAAMFKDFGGELPGLTILELSPVWHLAWAAALIASALAIPFLASERPTRLVLLGGLVLGGVGLVALFFVGMYSPIFTLAGNIH